MSQRIDYRVAASSQWSVLVRRSATAHHPPLIIKLKPMVCVWVCVLFFFEPKHNQTSTRNHLFIFLFRFFSFWGSARARDKIWATWCGCLARRTTTTTRKMWSVRANNHHNPPAPVNDIEESVPRRKYLWDKTQHHHHHHHHAGAGGGSWWVSGFRESHEDAVATRLRQNQLADAEKAEWNNGEGAVFDESVRQEKEAVRKWLAEDTARGVVRIYEARLNAAQSTVVRCTLATTAQQVCLKVGLPPNALHYQLNGDVIRRMDPFDCPLALQNDYLKCIGFDKAKRIQEEGTSRDMADFIRFYAGEWSELNHKPRKWIKRGKTNQKQSKWNGITLRRESTRDFGIFRTDFF